MFVLSLVAMFMVFLNLSPAFAMAPHFLERPKVCNPDNCLRGFQHQGSSASAFCSTYISAEDLITVTSTLTSTSTILQSTIPVTTVTEISYSAQPTTTLHSTVIQVQTITILRTITPRPTVTDTVITTIDGPQSIIPRFAPLMAAAPVHAFAAQFPASRISSACSCLVMMSIQTVTATMNTATDVLSIITFPTSTVYATTIIPAGI